MTDELVTRYRLREGNMEPSPFGLYVRHDDHAARIETDAATITAMKAMIRALLAQLEGQPVKHPQQAQEREFARWLVTPANIESEDRKGGV